MVKDKPYRKEDFKMANITQVLPLNRSYISKLFNDGYGETFYSFVMRYRIEESISLLENNLDLSIAQISTQCDFSSPSVFGRAFLKHKETTPATYRKEFLKNNKKEAI